MKVFILLLALLGTSLAVVDEFTGCIDGVRQAVARINFNGTLELGYWDKLCGTDMGATSLWTGAKVYCTPKEIDIGGTMIIGYCQKYGNVTLVPYAKVLPKLTDAYINSLPVAEYADSTAAAATVFYTPVLVSGKFFKSAKDTVVTFDYEYVLHKRYGWAVFGFWGGLLLIGMINRLATHVSQSRRLRARRDEEGTKPLSRSQKGPLKLASSVHQWLRSNVIIPASFGSHHSRPLLWSTIPTRMEMIVIVSFYIMTIILCSVGYYIFTPNLYYTRAKQGWRYSADRTGIISYAMLPWLWMFSGRNNIFLWLTGWNFTTFNVFHRHIARCATVLAIVHSIGWSVMEQGYLASEWKEKYWYMGGIATIAMSLAVFFSFMWFRVKSYEVFLLIHIALSVLTLVGLFYHTAIFTDREYDGYLWPPVAIWLFDRGARLIRWVYCNIHVKSSRSVVRTTASATYVKDGDFIRLDIVPGSAMLKPGPGQHYYLYQPLKWKGWENHPFTLGAYEKIGESDSAISSDTDSSNGPAKSMLQISSSPATSSTASPAPSHRAPSASLGTVGQQKLTFIVRPFGGWTRQLRDDCLKAPAGVINPHIFIEGPYGEESPLHAYENVVFVVGGSGITAALPYMLEHIRRAANTAQNSVPDQKLSTRTRDITLVWSARQTAMIRDIAAHELEPILRRDDIHVHLHVTSAAGKTVSLDDAKQEEGSGSDGDGEKRSQDLAYDGCSIAYGRPNISEVILGAIDNVNAAGSAGGRIAIMTCGPAGMADEARAAVHTALKSGKRGVEYVEETFGW